MQRQGSGDLSVGDDEARLLASLEKLTFSRLGRAGDRTNSWRAYQSAASGFEPYRRLVAILQRNVRRDAGSRLELEPVEGSYGRRS